jgi:HIP---CoA ligase
VSAATATSIPAVLLDAAARFAGREALVDGERRWSFDGVRDEALAVARALVAQGVQRGDRVAIWGHNHAEWAFAALGVYCAGAVVVPLNTRFKGSEAAYIIERSGARLLFTVNGFLGTDYVAMLGAAGRPDCVEQIVLLGGEPAEGCLPWEEFVAGGNAMFSDEVAARMAALSGEDLSEILFTSGTTGKPKGAMLRHGASVRAFDAWATVVGLGERDRYLMVNPFFHAFGLKAGILACLIKGAVMVPHAVFDVPQIMRRVVEERISMLPGTPAVYQTMLDHPGLHTFDLSTLRLAVTGAAVVPIEMVRRMYNELGFTTVVTGYGLTESTGISTMCRHDDDPETIATTCGRAIPDTEVRVVDEAGDAMPAGQPGEVVVRGYHVMAGYFNDAAATAAVIDADGWLHTGDVGVFDRHGNLRITDRLKDMFIVGGFNAYPAEIEQIMMNHPGVSQVAVIGVPDHRMGEVAKAFVVPRAAGALESGELLAWCREQMANYKVPRSIELVDALPLTASGKVMKHELRRS